MKTNKLLATVIALQGVILIGQWTGGSSIQSAHAQVPDPANRQLQMIEELKTLNSKMDDLLSVLKDGNLQVKVAKSEENSKGASHAK